MIEVKTEFKNNTIAIDFDGVIHQYSKGFQGLDNAYDPPMPGAIPSLQKLKDEGYRLIIVSSRPVKPIRNWLEKYNLSHFFDDVTNIKQPPKDIGFISATHIYNQNPLWSTIQNQLYIQGEQDEG
jgi:phosphoglycolate phosphatase-like HAD superfamily hydrolase